MFMSEQKTTQAGRRGFLKLLTASIPAAAVAAAAGTQAVASEGVEVRESKGLRKTEHYKKYLETARF
jgi:hypothetical protein